MSHWLKKNPDEAERIRSSSKQKSREQSVKEEKTEDDSMNSRSTVFTPPSFVNSKNSAYKRKQSITVNNNRCEPSNSGNFYVEKSGDTCNRYYTKEWLQRNTKSNGHFQNRKRSLHSNRRGQMFKASQEFWNSQESKNGFYGEGNYGADSYYGYGADGRAQYGYYGGY